RHAPRGASVGAAVTGHDAQAGGQQLGFWGAIVQIVVADVSMSLDNVLAVAGAAKGHTGVLIIGLAIAVVLMAVAASFIARLLVKLPWLTWVGLFIVLYVAIEMIWRGAHEVACAYVPASSCSEGLASAMKALLGG
ncbi:MAG TPA: hypothetical protein VFZ16_08365, partial [Hyphomicrobiaceae bacterium]|nr:hypothetical protein [Hyphomicrobiaceae bacterium]